MAAIQLKASDWEEGFVTLGFPIPPSDLGAGRWDWVALAHYPSRAAFLEMMTSPEYATINVDRENGVEDHVILVANQTYSKLAAKSAPS